MKETLRILRLLNVTRRKLGIGKDRKYALTDYQGDSIHNINNRVKLSEGFYSWLQERLKETAEHTSIARDVHS